MRDRIRIDDSCRTERYYTATLLPHILFHESFAGLRAFLCLLVDKQIPAVDAETHASVPFNGRGPLTNIELITEVALVRDAKFYASWIEGLKDIEWKEAEELRPDLVVVADDLLVVLEAKFFLGSTSQKQIRKQLLDQREVIRKVYLRFPGYRFRRYCHLFLSVTPPTSAEAVGCQGLLSWADIRALAEQVLGGEHYVTQRLTRALEWYHRSNSWRRATGPNYQGKGSLTDVLRMCERRPEAIIVGYDGGLSALAEATPRYLEARPFKWDSAENLEGKQRRNWIAGDDFLNVIRTRFPERLS
jgi:hypothetical protein